MSESSLQLQKQEVLSEPFVYKTMAEIEQENPSVDELPHRHDYFTIIYIEQAGGLHHIDFKTYALAPHTIHFVSPEQVHHMALSSASPVGHVLLMSPDFLQQYSISPAGLLDRELFFNCDEVAPVQVPEEQLTVFSRLFQQIQAEYQQQSYQHLDMLGAYLTQFLVLCQRIKQHRNQHPTPRAYRKAEIVRQFKKDLESHYTKEHKVATYAGLQHLSSVYLNEVIKHETGSSAKEMIQNRIVLEAKRIALYTDASMKEIAWDLGFEDPAHFSKLFKKCQGMTFTEYRASLQVSKHK